MAAPKNDRQRELIYQAGIRLFMANGYNATTYADIAVSCGATKSIVQYYFPKKSQFVRAYFDRYLTELMGRLDLAGDDFMKLFGVVGLIHYDELLNNAEARPFYFDVLASRELTESIVQVQTLWAAEQVSGACITGASVPDELTVFIGGMYDLIYQSWRNGVQLTPEYMLYAVIFPFALLMGYDEVRAREIMEASIAAFREYRR